MPQRFNPFSDRSIVAPSSKDSSHPDYVKLQEYLQNGNTINFVQARELGISHLDKHIEDLRKRMNVHSRMIRISNTRCNEYSLQPFV